jgi:Cof subfamily protein (haloacid dehalogenase superfamily)
LADILPPAPKACGAGTLAEVRRLADGIHIPDAFPAGRFPDCARGRGIVVAGEGPSLVRSLSVNRAPTTRFLAAIDLDGTLFGPDSRIDPANYAALERLAQHGFAIALASGRHPRNMADIAAALPMVCALVSCQGCEVSDPDRQQILSQTFMQRDAVAETMAAGLHHGFGVIAYSEHGELTPVESPEVALYRKVVHTEVVLLEAAALARERVFKVMWIGDGERLDSFLAAGGHQGCNPASADSVRSHRIVFEYVPRGVSKASGTAALAHRLGLEATQVAAFGDADNDLALFNWAGFSVAMPHARAGVRAQASVTATAGPAESAFARGVDLLLGSPWFTSAR